MKLLFNLKINFELAKELQKEYGTLIDIDSKINKKKTIFELLIKFGNKNIDHIKKINNNAENTYIENVKSLETNYKDKFNKLDSDYKIALNKYYSLTKEISILTPNLESMDYGIYDPIFDYECSEEYKAEIECIRNHQKKLIKDDCAAYCNTEWVIEGDIKKGRAFTKNYKQLILRAFNGECDALISKVKWNNFDNIYARIKRSFEKINEMGNVQYIQITKEYYDSKIKELKLSHEYNLKKYQEKVAEQDIRMERREEEKTLREIERERRYAEEEEKRYLKAFLNVQKDIEGATGAKLEQLVEKLKYLETELKEAQQNKERALSMAQQTRRGYVYIISNIGSFGENVYKIGMTRRLDPIDRVKELSNASVPFNYDIHAMLFTEDAPSLEASLHQAFDDHKVNKINNRKEFFKVSIEDIEKRIKESGIKTEFIKIAEARDYRETISIKNKNITKDKTENEINKKYADSLYDYEE